MRDKCPVCSTWRLLVNDVIIFRPWRKFPSLHRARLKDSLGLYFTSLVLSRYLVQSARDNKILLSRVPCHCDIDASIATGWSSSNEHSRGTDPRNDDHKPGLCALYSLSSAVHHNSPKSSILAQNPKSWHLMQMIQPLILRFQYIPKHLLRTVMPRLIRLLGPVLKNTP